MRKLETLKKLQIAAERHGCSYLTILKHSHQLYKRTGLKPGEALSYGLEDPGIPIEVQAGCISRAKLFAYQARVNPQRWLCLTEDKSVFYAYCRSVGIKTSAPLAVFHPTNGRTSDGQIIRNRSDWLEYFDQSLSSEFITKPAQGRHGEAIHLYRRAEKGLVDELGEGLSIPELYDRLSTGATYSRFIVQERIRNHTDISEFTGSDALQTARIVTFIDEFGKSEIYLTLFKIIVGDNINDNYNYGMSGNLTANVCLSDGTLGAATGSAHDGIGFSIVHAHPVTGRAIEEFRLPDWNAAIELVKRASHLFFPLRTIGWDVAFTPSGPILIEGNSWWDAFNHLVVGPQALDCRRGDMAGLLAKLRTAVSSDSPD